MQVRKDTTIRRKEIITAARKLIVKNGSESVTVRRVAKEIGVSEGAIYRHFKSKKEIYLLLIEDIEETLIQDIEKNDTGNVNSLEVLQRIVMEQISSIEQRKGVIFLAIAEIISLGDKDLNRKVSKVLNNYLERLNKILANGVDSGFVRRDINLDAAGKMLFGMTQGLVNLWALNQYSFKLEKEFQPLWEIFLKSVMNEK